MKFGEFLSGNKEDKQMFYCICARGGLSQLICWKKIIDNRNNPSYYAF